MGKTYMRACESLPYLTLTIHVSGIGGIMLKNHPLRHQVISEMHLRQMPPIAAPCEMKQVVRIVALEVRAEEQDVLCRMSGAILPFGRHLSGSFEDQCRWLWERHSEATTLTLIAPGGRRTGVSPFCPDALALLHGLPGEVIRAVKLHIVENEHAAQKVLKTLSLNEAETVSCYLHDARLWSDFRIHEADGYGHLVLATNGMHPADMGRIVQRLQELGNYRNMALLGLPMAQSEGVKLSQLEERLAHLTSEDSGERNDRVTLESLMQLAAEAASLRSQTAYRMSATAAYGQIVQDRLEQLAPRAIPAYQSLSDFTERRMLPALRTCASFTQRLDTLAEHIEQASNLLRTRVDLALQDQNAAMLASMDKSTTRQLELQHLVEGLSSIAMTYYAIGLIGYMLKGASHWLPIPVEYGMAAAVIPVFFIIRWIVQSRLKH